MEESFGKEYVTFSGMEKEDVFGADASDVTAGDPNPNFTALFIVFPISCFSITPAPAPAGLCTKHVMQKLPPALDVSQQGHDQGVEKEGREGDWMERVGWAGVGNLAFIEVVIGADAGAEAGAGAGAGESEALGPGAGAGAGAGGIL